MSISPIIFALGWVVTGSIALGSAYLLKKLGYHLGYGYGREEHGVGLDKLIDETTPEREILIFGLYSWFEDPKFKDWVKEASERDVKVRGVVGLNIDVDRLKEYLGIIQIRKVNRPLDIQFIMVDDKKGYVDNYSHSSYVKRFYKRTKNNFRREFNAYWEQGERLDNSD